MNYSKPFKAGVTKLYPNSEEVRRMLDSGDPNVVSHLQNKSDTFSIEDVLAATSLVELQIDARARMAKNALYAEWKRLYREQCLNDSSKPDGPNNPKDPNKPDAPDEPKDPNKPDAPDEPDEPKDPNKP